MADLSSYSPIYIRVNGNDSTGDGSINAPFLTAQKAFEMAYDISQYGGSNELLVLDFGIGNFGGVNLATANATEWPNNIAVRGVNLNQSFLGEINGNGNDGIIDYETYTDIVVPSNGKDIYIISNNSISINTINSNGGNGISVSFGISTRGGNLIIKDIQVHTINCFSGSVTIHNSNIQIITCDGTYIIGGNGTGTSGGNINIYNSNITTINNNGNIFDDYGQPGGINNIVNSKVQTINSAGGVSAYGIGSGGTVTIDNSFCRYITVGSVMDNTTVSQDGSVIIIGYCVLPDSITRANIEASRLIRNYTINSSLLGVI